MLEAGGVERVADRPDAAVHHVGRRDDVGAGRRLTQRRGRHLLDRLVVDDDALAQDAVMAVAGERVERGVGDDADLRAPPP